MKTVIIAKLLDRLKRLCAVVVLPLALVGCDIVLDGANVPEVLDPQEVIALIPIEASTDEIVTGAAAQGFSLREDVLLDGLDLRMLRFTFPAPLSGKDAIDVLETIEPASTAGINHIYQPAAREDLARLDYAQSMMNWPVARCQSRLSVGVIDTSIDVAALEGSGARIVTQDFLRGRAPSTQHGTDVVSVLVDDRRVANATVYSAAVIGRTDQGHDVSGVDSILRALDWLALNNVSLVNMSISGPYNKLLDEGVAQAVDAGMMIVAAVGNDGPTAQPRYPAAFDTVIAVTAVDAEGAIFEDAVRGAHVDIAAPGVDVLIEQGGDIRFVTGTSIATPFVTARIMTDQTFSGLDMAAARRALLQNATEIGEESSQVGLELLGPPSRCQQATGGN